LMNGTFEPARSKRSYDDAINYCISLNTEEVRVDTF
jgi:hypothetical protein